MEQLSLLVTSTASSPSVVLVGEFSSENCSVPPRNYTVVVVVVVVVLTELVNSLIRASRLIALPAGPGPQTARMDPASLYLSKTELCPGGGGGCWASSH